MLNVEPSNLVFLQTNTTFDKIIIRFTDQNGRLLPLEDKVNLTLLINKKKCRDLIFEPRTRKYVNGFQFLSFARNVSNKYREQLLDTGLYSIKTASKNVVHITSEFLENKIAYALAKSYDDITVKIKPVEEIIIPPEKGEEARQL